MKNKESISKLKKQIKDLDRENSSLKWELESYRSFNSRLFKDSIVNLKESKVTNPLWLVKELTIIYQRHKMPFFHWND